VRFAEFRVQGSKFQTAVHCIATWNFELGTLNYDQGRAIVEPVFDLGRRMSSGT
jgi:hypothetical protein